MTESSTSDDCWCTKLADGRDPQEAMRTTELEPEKDAQLYKYRINDHWDIYSTQPHLTQGEVLQVVESLEKM